MKKLITLSAIALSTLLLTTATQANEEANATKHETNTTKHEAHHAKHWGYMVM